MTDRTWPEPDDQPLDVDILADLDAGLFDAATAKALQQRIQNDADARHAMEAFAAVRRDLATLRARPAPEMPPELADRIDAAVSEELRHQRSHRPPVRSVMDRSNPDMRRRHGRRRSARRTSARSSVATVAALVSAAAVAASILVVGQVGHRMPNGPANVLSAGNGLAEVASPPLARSVDKPTLGPVTAVGREPGDIAISPNGRYALIAFPQSETLGVWDTAANKLTGSIPVSTGAPASIAFAPDGKRVYVTTDGTDGNGVYVLDPATSTKVSFIPTGGQPDDVAITADGKHLVVANRGNDTVIAIDTSTDRISASVAVPADPTGLDVAADGKRIYVAADQTSQIVTIDTGTFSVIAQTAVGDRPTAVLRHPIEPVVFSANAFGDSISFIDADTAAVVNTIAVARQPDALALSADGEHLYVAAAAANAVQVISVKTREVTARIPVGSNPTKIAISPDGRRGYVLDHSDGTVTSINLVRAA